MKYYAIVDNELTDPLREVYCCYVGRMEQLPYYLSDPNLRSQSLIAIVTEESLEDQVKFYKRYKNIKRL